ncbi:MAG: ABC transporter permease [Pseudomonadota bacterium]
MSVSRRPAVWVLLSVSLLPTAAGLAAALWYGLDSAALARVLATPGVGRSIATSVWTGSLATLIALVLAHLIVAMAASGQWRGRLNALMVPLLAMPHLAIGIGLALVLAPSGLLMRLVSPWATGYALPPDWLIVNDPAGLSLIAGLVLKETCFLVMALGVALAQVPSSQLTLQTATLGYGPLKGWFVAVAPALQRQIRLPLAAVFVFGITNVEMAIPLGPGLPPTFSVLLWRWFTDPDPLINAQAYAGTLVLLGVCGVALLLAAVSARVGRVMWTLFARSGRRRTAEKPLRRVLGTAVAAGWLLGALAIVAIGFRALSGPWRFPDLVPDRLSLGTLEELAMSLTGVGGTTLALALATALAGLAFVVPAAEHCRQSATARQRIGACLFLPLLLPQMTFLFGVQVFLIRLAIDGSFIAVLWSHLIFTLPYLWGILASARAAIEPRYEQVAVTLGVSKLSAWCRITAPLLARSGLTALALAVSVSVALYLPTLFAGAGRFATAATEAVAAAGSGNLRLASGYAVLLAILPLAAFAVALSGGQVLFRNRRGVPR